MAGVRLPAVLGLVLVSLAIGGSPVARAGSQTEARVLFIGNSLTRFNVMPSLFGRLAADGTVAPALPTRSMARGGYTLRMHWRNRDTRAALESGAFSHVVLQDHSLRPLDRSEEFEEYLTRFTRLAETAETRAVLYETWPRRRGHAFYRERPALQGPEDMSTQIAGAYDRMGQRLGAVVAPVGRAFMLGARRRPDIPLYRPDGLHPSWAGSFLAACVLYGTVTGEDPQASGYAPWELRPDQALALKQIAADTLRGL